jgi:hypothetical protein
MSYLTQNDIVNSPAMNARVAQAAAEQHAPYDPDRWTHDYRRTWAAAPGWDAAWESFKASHPDPEDPPADYVSPDPGADPGVITDGQILAQVQSMIPPPVEDGPETEEGPPV